MERSKQPADDERCGFCLEPLPETPQPFSWEDHGFCSKRCALRFHGGLSFYGLAALQMAHTPGDQGGPGFEKELIARWVDCGTPAGPIMLRRLRVEDSIPPSMADQFPANSWDWSLWSGGLMHARRFTRRRSEGEGGKSDAAK